MRLAELVHLPRLTWFAGGLAASLALALALRPVAVSAPAQVDYEDPIEITVRIHDNVGDPPCAADVTQHGDRVSVHLIDNPNTCAGVTRIYHYEGDVLVFDQERVDL